METGFIHYQTVTHRKDDLQEYIDLHIAKQDDKYLMWFLHCHEAILNDTVMEEVEKSSMKAHFADIKQACVTGSFKALEKYRNILSEKIPIVFPLLLIDFFKINFIIKFNVM